MALNSVHKGNRCRCAHPSTPQESEVYGLHNLLHLLNPAASKSTAPGKPYSCVDRKMENSYSLTDVEPPSYGGLAPLVWEVTLVEALGAKPW